MITAKDEARLMVDMWDGGNTVWSIAMGGLGPGYEQAIQVLMIEIVRDYLSNELPDEASWGTFGDSTIARIDYRLPDGKYALGGFSGAQVGAAKQLAYSFLSDGTARTLAKVDSDRKIQISNYWPRVSESKVSQPERASTEQS